MKTVINYSDIPGNAVYMGSELPDGTIEMFFADLIADAVEPIRYRDENGIHHFFDLCGY
jgi:hypothetical protein